MLFKEFIRLRGIRLRQRKGRKNMNSITAVEEYYGSNNKPAKRRCIIYDRYTGKDFPVAHSMSDIIELFNVKSNKVGYGSSI
jgi:hypothetical protein